MRAREADALDAVDGVACAQQLAELRRDVGQQVPSPRVDVLTEQCQLLDPAVGKALHLGEDLARAPALLAPAHGGDDAVRALRVTAHRHLHPRLERALVVHRQLGREVTIVETEATARDADPTGAEPLAEVCDRSRAERDVDRGIELEDALALRFRVAAADGDHAIRVLAASVPLQRRGTPRASGRASRGSCTC